MSYLATLDELRASCYVASYADALWARHAIFLPHERLLKRPGTFLTLCSKRLAGQHVEITKQPIGAWVLFNRKPIISCDRTTPKRMINFQILASCMEETPKKNRQNNCFLCSFPLIPQARIRMFGKMRCGNRFERVFVQRPVRLQ